MPNSASGLAFKLGAMNAAAMDINTACTSFLYALSTATAMIRTGVVRNAVVVGVELISPFMDWANRGVAVLFGDGAAAVVLQASEREEGVLAEKLGCYADARQILRVRGMGTTYANRGVSLGDTIWDFDGQEIFKRAVRRNGQRVAGRARRSRGIVPMRSTSSSRTRRTCGSSKPWPSALDAPMDRVYLTIQRYGNMSAATVPVALVEALEEGRVKPGALILTPAFGGGLTWCSHLIRWGERTTPLAASDAKLPPPAQSALERIRELMAIKAPHGRSDAGLMGATLAEARPATAGNGAASPLQSLARGVSTSA